MSARPWGVFGQHKISVTNTLWFVTSCGTRESARRKAQAFVSDGQYQVTRVTWRGRGPDPRTQDQRDADREFRPLPRP